VTVGGLSHQGEVPWLAALVHRLSGVALAAFLPFHFLALGLALDGEARFDGFLRWTEQPLVKFAEGGLVFLFVVHMAGGLRLLWLENFAWHDNQKGLAIAAAAVAAAVALGFLAVAF
jgi:succinate dehydrogenase subunit D